MHRAPIGDHEAVEAPLDAEYVRQQAAAVAAIDAVYLVVGAHDCARPPLLDRQFEAAQVELAQSALVEDAVGAKALPLLGIRGKVLGAGRRPRALEAAYKSGGELAGQQRILAEILEVPPAEGRALEVQARPEHDADAPRQGLPPDGAPDLGEQALVPGPGEGDRGREAGGRGRGMDAEHVEAAAALAISQPMRAVAEPEGGNIVLFEAKSVPVTGSLAEPHGQAERQGRVRFPRHTITSSAHYIKPQRFRRGISSSSPVCESKRPVPSDA